MHTMKLITFNSLTDSHLKRFNESDTVFLNFQFLNGFSLDVERDRIIEFSVVFQFLNGFSQDKNNNDKCV